MKHTLLIITLCLLIFICAVGEVQAQSPKDMVLAETLFAPKGKVDYKQFVKENKNEVEYTLSAMFLLYKNFISSQDIDACIFQPSCSVYAIECIHLEKNKLIAFLKITDRLMRCHPLVSKGDYLTDEKTRKNYDPVEN